MKDFALLSFKKIHNIVAIMASNLLYYSKHLKINAFLHRRPSMKWIYKLDYKYGKHYISHLMKYIVIGMAIVSVADFAFLNFNLSYWLMLDREAILSGQVWRLITFIFVPAGGGLNIWTLVTLYFYYSIGEALESIWGGFRFNLYYLFGIIGAIITCFISPMGYASNSYLNLSLFLAFATIAPDTIFSLFFFIPIKAKWLAIFYAGFTAISLVQNFLQVLGGSFLLGISGIIAVLLSLIGYFIFFGPRLIELIKNQIRINKNRRQWRNR